MRRSLTPKRVRRRDGETDRIDKIFLFIAININTVIEYKLPIFSLFHAYKLSPLVPPFNTRPLLTCQSEIVCVVVQTLPLASQVVKVLLSVGNVDRLEGLRL